MSRISFRGRSSILLVFIFLWLFGLPQKAESAEYGILVGVTTYDPELATYDLAGPYYDVRNIAESWVMSDGMNADNIEVVSGKNATKEGILAAFKRVAGKVRPNDTVRIAWSGHGGIGVMVAKNGALHREDLQRLVDVLPVKNIEFFITTCFACSNDVDRAPGKRIVILGAVGPYELGQQMIVAPPDIPENMPNETKVVGAYLFSKAYGRSSPNDKFQRADRDHNGKVDLIEAMKYMNSHGPVRAPHPVKEQKACIKDGSAPKRSGPWMENLSHGRLVITVDGTGEDIKQNHHYSAKTKSYYTINFDLKRTGLPYEPGNLRSDMMVYKVTAYIISYRHHEEDVTVTPDNTYTHTDHAANTVESDPLSLTYSYLYIYPNEGIYQLQLASPAFQINETGTGSINFVHCSYIDRRHERIWGSRNWSYMDLADVNVIAQAAQEETNRIYASRMLPDEKRLKSLKVFIGHPSAPTIPSMWIGYAVGRALGNDRFTRVAVSIHAEWSIE